MPKQESDVRYVYCTHGNIIDELKRIGPAPKTIPAGGNDHYLAAFLQWSGCSPTLLMASTPENAVFSMDNVQVKTFRHNQNGGKTVMSYLEEIALFFRVFLQLVSFRPTKILCAKIGPALWACYLYARLWNVPLAHSRHTRVDVLFANPLRKLWFYLDRWVLRRLPAVICHGPYLDEQLRGIGVPVVNIIQYSVDYRYLLTNGNGISSAPDLKKDSDPFVIFFAGRIHHNKGIFDLLSAAMPLLEKNPNVQLVYAGEGPDLPSLEKMVRESSSASQVSVLGFVHHEKLPGLIQQSRVVVAPTRLALTEGLCRVVPESFVLGRPVVAPDFGPFPYLIDDGVNGLLFQPENVEDLRGKLEKMIQDELYCRKLASGAASAGKRHLKPEIDFPKALRKALGV